MRFIHVVMIASLASCGPHGSLGSASDSDRSVTCESSDRLDDSLQRGLNHLLDAKYDRPFYYLIANILHRRFGLEPLRFAVEHYEGILRSSDSAQLRVFHRIARHDAPVNPADLDLLMSEWDQLSARALHCDRIALPVDYDAALSNALQAGEYGATHALLALAWMRDHGCQLRQPAQLETMVVAAVRKLLPQKAAEVGDLELEATAMLAYFSGPGAIDCAPIEAILGAQLDNGGWSHWVGGHTSDWHATTLAMWALGELLTPNAHNSPVETPPLGR